MQTASDLIEQLGGTVSVAVALGIAPTTVSSWKSAGSIPRWRMDGIRALASDRGVRVSFTPAPRSQPERAA